MRSWTKSACVVLAWTILSITLVTAGITGSVHPAQATIRQRVVPKTSSPAQPPSLVRRPDGQIIQMSPLLYRVMCGIDGSRNPAAIAKLVSEDLGRTLNAEQVRRLVTAKLLP